MFWSLAAMENKEWTSSEEIIPLCNPEIITHNYNIRKAQVDYIWKSEVWTLLLSFFLIFDVIIFLIHLRETEILCNNYFQVT